MLPSRAGGIFAAICSASSCGGVDQVETRELLLRLRKRPIGNRDVAVADANGLRGFNREQRLGREQQALASSVVAAVEAFAIGNRVNLSASRYTRHRYFMASAYYFFRCLSSLCRLLRGRFSCGGLLHQLEVVRFLEPLGQRRLDLVAMWDLNIARALPSTIDDLLDLRRLDGAAEENTTSRNCAWADEEIAGPASEHDGAVRRVDALLAEVQGGFAKPP